MILLIDAGNSRLKWACMVAGALQPGEPLVRSGNASDDVRSLSLAWAPLPAPRRVLMASVLGPDFACELSHCTMDAWSVPVESITAQRTAHGITNAYAEPERLGVDRWLALLAARRTGSGAACVIDCGTAITVDALREDGTHLGGLIMPGLGLMRRMLTQGTRATHLAADEESAGEALPFATDTRSAVFAGTLHAAAGAIDRAVAGMFAGMEGEPQRLITGGDAARLRPLLARPESYELHPELVFEGMMLFAMDEKR
ncbi:MAG: type III pantothenate kinase [Gammaproteobacteria bacterium]|jgi:type III pantothenate kinase|nr:type III pantothenate kinase [Gammaproteobacteria bacterium]